MKASYSEEIFYVYSITLTPYCRNGDFSEIHADSIIMTVTDLTEEEVCKTFNFKAYDYLGYVLNYGTALGIDKLDATIDKITDTHYGGNIDHPALISLKYELDLDADAIIKTNTELRKPGIIEEPGVIVDSNYILNADGKIIKSETLVNLSMPAKYKGVMDKLRKEFKINHEDTLKDIFRQYRNYTITISNETFTI